ncbi:MAG TPA: hypothetical protein VGF07_05745 [Stellaceae bacterium]
MARIVTGWRRLARALRRHGFAGSLRLVPANLRHALAWLRPHSFRARRAIAAFDRRFGVDTAGFRAVTSLDVPPALAAHAVRYEPVAEIAPYLGALAIRFEDYSFIDYGSGKGRVLLMASDFPFRQITGIEFAPELAAIARRNLERYRSQNQKCAAIEVIEGDAGAFAPKPGPTVFFLYNPFDGVVLDRVLARIRESGAVPSLVSYLIYVDPRHRASIDRDPVWEIAADHRSWVLYRTRTAAPRGADGARPGAAAAASPIS